VREARGKFLQYAEFRYRQFLSDPQQRPHAVACLHFNDWEACRDRFGFAGLEALNHQIERRVIPLLGRKDICARFSDASLVMVIAADKDRHGVEERTRRLLEAAAARPLNVGQPLEVTFSLAMCWFDRRVRSAEEALFDAMHLAELLANRGGNAFRVYQPDMRAEDTGGAEDVLERIRACLQMNHMRLVFQPLLSADAMSLKYAQVWARLLAADGGRCARGASSTLRAAAACSPGWIAGRSGARCACSPPTRARRSGYGCSSTPRSTRSTRARWTGWSRRSGAIRTADTA
jgi:GGDEF domain-containing protein